MGLQELDTRCWKLYLVARPEKGITRKTANMYFLSKRLTFLEGLKRRRN